jgi:hypothetical protein
VVQFELTVDQAVVDIELAGLLSKRFHASSVRATGVGYRMLTRVTPEEARAARVAAFPTMEAFEAPPLVHDPPYPELTPAEIATLWTVQLDEIDAFVTELWFFEYRYSGPAHVQGGFELSPLRHLEVGPATLELQGGALSAGEHVVAPALTARATVSIAPVELSYSMGSALLSALSASMVLDTDLEDLGVLGLYTAAAQARGAVAIKADLRVSSGLLMQGSFLEAKLPRLNLRASGVTFAGAARARLEVEGEQQTPTVNASLAGELGLPLKDEVVKAALTEVSAAAMLVSNDLAAGPALDHLFVTLGEARVVDARAITGAVSKLVPVFAPMVLGEGPLVASATAYVTPKYSLLRLKHLKLGDAELEGAVVPGANGLSGAMAGHFGTIPVGLRLKGAQVESVLFAPNAWLGVELRKAGIEPDTTATTTARP